MKWLILLVLDINWRMYNTNADWKRANEHVIWKGVYIYMLEETIMACLGPRR